MYVHQDQDDIILPPSVLRVSTVAWNRQTLTQAQTNVTDSTACVRADQKNEKNPAEQAEQRGERKTSPTLQPHRVTTIEGFLLVCSCARSRRCWWPWSGCSGWRMPNSALTGCCSGCRPDSRDSRCPLRQGCTRRPTTQLKFHSFSNPYTSKEWTPTYPCTVHLGDNSRRKKKMQM